jgi:hypothetical protein
MSDTAQGSGWWQASDGRWYPPDARPGVPPPPEAASAGWSSPPGGPSSGWDIPQAPGSSSSGGWAQPSVSQYRTSTNGFAVAALVLGIIGIPAVLVLVGLLLAVLALIFGLVARSQIQRSGGAQGGGGMAVAGIVLGGVGIVLEVIIIVVAATTGGSGGSGY